MRKNGYSRQIAAVICEYNPFHSGHAYQLQKTRESGATHIVAVMSGSFVQRGEPSMLSKWARARCALLSGADLVIELPLPWSMAGAERFAAGGVFLANALGCVDLLSFGSECGEISLLQAAAEAAVSPEIQAGLRHYLSAGLPYAAARQKAVADAFGETLAGVYKNPNDILAVEYLKALKQSSSAIRPMTVRRIGAGHDSAPGETGAFASASYLRSMILGNQLPECRPFLPADVYSLIEQEILSGRAPASLALLERPILAKLRTMAATDFLGLPDVSEGLQNRIAAAVGGATTLDNLFTKIKTKRYTHARIRRIIVSAFLGNYRTFGSGFPPYIRVLGMNEKGTEILRTARKTASIPIVLKASQFKGQPDNIRQIAALESRGTDLSALASPIVLPCGMDSGTGVIRMFAEPSGKGPSKDVL